MKKTLFTIAATTASLAAIAYGLLHFQYFFLLSQNDMASLQAQFEAIYNEGYKYFQLFQMCKNST